MCAGSTSDYAPIVNRYAVECDVTVISVEYRLAPEDKAPAGLLDACSALMWILHGENTHELEIDEQRIAVVGDDAGGWVCMAVC